MMELANKSNMNKYLKTVNPIRDEASAETDTQWWNYIGPTKASG